MAKVPTSFRNALRGLIRPLVATAIVLWLLSRVDLPEMLVSARNVETVWLAAGIGALFAEALARSANWHQVLNAIGIRVPSFLRLVQKHFLAGFIGTLLPSSMGTDVLRSLFSKQLAGGRISRHALAVAITNAVSFAAGLILILVSLIWLHAEHQARLGPTVLIGILGLAALVSGFGFIALPLRMKAGLVKVMPVSRTLRRRLMRLIARMGRDLRRIIRQLPAIGAGATVALLFQAVAYAVLGRSAEVDMPVSAWLMLPTLIALVGILPASFLGFGATQVAVVAILIYFGNSEEQAVLTATLIALTGLFVKISGGVAAMIVDTSSGAPRAETM